MSEQTKTLQWSQKFTSQEAAKYWMTKGFVAVELYDADMRKKKAGMELFIKNIGETPKDVVDPEPEENIYIVNKDESIFGVGSSIPEALGNLILNHREVFGIEVKLQHDSRVGNPAAPEFNK